MELQTITITLISSPNSQKAFQQGCVAIATCVVFIERSKRGGCKTQLCDWHPSHAELIGLLSVICSNKQYNSTLRSGCILEYYVWYVFSSWKTVHIFISTACHSLSDKLMACFSYTADMHFPKVKLFCFWISQIISMCFPDLLQISDSSPWDLRTQEKVQSNEKCEAEGETTSQQIRLHREKSSDR